MGGKQLDKPKRMGEKVRDIRLRLGLTQQEMFELLERHGAKIHIGYIGLYEVNERVPAIKVALAYARAAGIPMETLVDDEMNLPKNFR
jgi:transcriptional regulator with XRE-family HTH domain